MLMLLGNEGYYTFKRKKLETSNGKTLNLKYSKLLLWLPPLFLFEDVLSLRTDGSFTS